MNALAQVVYDLARGHRLGEAEVASLSNTERVALSEALLALGPSPAALARRLSKGDPADEWPSPVLSVVPLEAAEAADEWPSPAPYVRRPSAAA